ncbi:MAG: ImmA/IrrE family metallo-endopeptidase [Planctomycetota bacterium]
MAGIARDDVPWLHESDIRAAADGCIARADCTGRLPVPVDEIIEFAHELDIVPNPHLRSVDVESYLLYHDRQIWIDGHQFTHEPHRSRFTLAHELGHFILHGKVLESLEITDLDGYLKFHEEADRAAIERLEWQARAFAGALLVPREELEREFLARGNIVAPMISDAKAAGFARHEYLQVATDTVADMLRPVFEASRQCIAIRIMADGLHESL